MSLGEAGAGLSNLRDLHSHPCPSGTSLTLTTTCTDILSTVDFCSVSWNPQNSCRDIRAEMLHVRSDICWVGPILDPWHSHHYHFCFTLYNLERSYSYTICAKCLAEWRCVNFFEEQRPRGHLKWFNWTRKWCWSARITLPTPWAQHTDNWQWSNGTQEIRI